MAYDKIEKERILNSIFNDIAEGCSLRKALLKNKLQGSTFYEWIDDDEEKSKQYARACEDRAEFIVEEIYEIADDNNADVHVDDDGNKIVDGENIQRAKLRCDVRKWHLSKLMPKKYGNKVDVTTNGKEITQPTPLVLQDGRTYDDLKNELKPE